MMHIHRLEGCSPTPLAHYLKALGILRLVAEQADPDARGWWAGENFCLATKLEYEQLIDFFLTRYQPTALFNPWGGRSGFYPDGSEKAARVALEKITACGKERFDRYKFVIEEARRVVTECTGGEKPETSEAKQELLNSLRKVVRGAESYWIDTVSSVIENFGDVRSVHPAIFGTGGNEGSGSYTSGYMNAICECLVDRKWDKELPAVLFDVQPEILNTWSQTLGQFKPSGPVVPWELLLAFEGACMLRSSITRRGERNAPKWLSSPYYMAPLSAGYPSGARLDEYALKNGKELPGRGEQWFPLWKMPMGYQEVTQVFLEGKATFGRNSAKNSWSMIRAIAARGAANGIQEFVRYGYQQRNNLATHFAVPLGRYRQPEYVDVRLSCLDDIERWLESLRIEAKDAHTPASLRIAERRLTNALIAAIDDPANHARWQTALLHLAEAEAVILTNPKSRVGKLPPLRPAWVQAADDGAAELRLACAFALQAGHFYKDGGAASPVRNHWVARKNEETDRVMRGRSGLGDAIAVVERRLITAARQDRRRLPLLAAPKAYASLTDLAALIAGEVDLDRTLALARALMALDSRQWAADPRPPVMPGDHAWPDDAWCLLRLAMLPWPVEDHAIPVDPALFRRLSTGDAGQAVVIARRRLRAAGIVPTIRGASLPPQTARRWAAAMAFPIVPFQAKQLLRRLDPNTITEE